jgi:hypothetical protein
MMITGEDRRMAKRLGISAPPPGPTPWWVVVALFMLVMAIVASLVANGGAN